MIENEVYLRLGFFIIVLLTMALWESIRPKRNLRISRALRWLRNLSLAAMGVAAVRLLLPFSAVTTALYAQQQQLGLFNHLPLPLIATVIISVLLLDLIIYTQHVLFHHVPLLWRLHKVHHIDQDIDVTTGLRFHPLEIIISMLIKCAAILLLGIPVVAVVTFEILLNATAMFNHGNVSMPSALDRWLRLLVVTPDMHRVHHSVIVEETNSNFGFNLPWWDRLFSTYRAQPRAGHMKMTIGLEQYQDINKTGLWQLLIIPLR